MIFGPKRYVDPAIKLNDIPKIDILLLTHNHYDHLDISTVRNFPHKKAKVITPLKLSRYFNNFDDLNELDCHNNLLTNLDLSGATALTHLSCNDNQLTSFDLSQNTALETLLCWNNQLTSLDGSNHFPLETLACYNNQLSSLDISYMNYMDMYFLANNNPNLLCIDVDDVAFPIANWTVSNGNIDAQHYFSTNCSGSTSIQEHTTNKELLKVTDLLGRKTKQTNQPLFYIYDNGTVEKRIVIE